MKKKLYRYFKTNSEIIYMIKFVNKKAKAQIGPPALWRVSELVLTPKSKELFLDELDCLQRSDSAIIKAMMMSDLDNTGVDNERFKGRRAMLKIWKIT